MTCDIVLIGFGEAGSAFARAANWRGRARGFDVAPQRVLAMEPLGVAGCVTAAAALQNAPLVLSLVTAGAALAAAQAGAPLLARGALWCDMNSVAPGTKRAAQEAIEAAGGRYVDVAVMAPVNPLGLAVPLLVAGAAAGDACAALAELGFTNLRAVGPEVGRASAIKMIRSVMVKGVEALTAEMMLAGQAAGVTEEVLASLNASEKPGSWNEKAAYNLERMASHGLRRAAEMDEVANTLAALGVQPIMSEGTARRQREMASETNQIASDKGIAA